jgi:hypothetical protein
MAEKATHCRPQLHCRSKNRLFSRHSRFTRLGSMNANRVSACAHALDRRSSVSVSIAVGRLAITTE